MALPDPHTLNLIVRAGVRSVAIDFGDYSGGKLRPKDRTTLHRTLDAALDAINDEIRRSTAAGSNANTR